MRNGDAQSNTYLNFHRVRSSKCAFRYRSTMISGSVKKIPTLSGLTLLFLLFTGGAAQEAPCASLTSAAGCNARAKCFFNTEAAACQDTCTFTGIQGGEYWTDLPGVVETPMREAVSLHCGVSVDEFSTTCGPINKWDVSGVTDMEGALRLRCAACAREGGKSACYKFCLCCCFDRAFVPQLQQASGASEQSSEHAHTQT